MAAASGALLNEVRLLYCVAAVLLAGVRSWAGLAGV
jgi:hypothetical protein